MKNKNNLFFDYYIFHKHEKNIKEIAFVFVFTLTKYFIFLSIKNNNKVEIIRRNYYFEYFMHRYNILDSNNYLNKLKFISLT